MLFNNVLKCSVVLFGLFHLASTTEHNTTFRCFRSSIDDYEDHLVEKPEGLIQSSNNSTPCVDVTKKTCVVAIGYKYLLYGPLLKALLPTLIDSKQCNVILVIWDAGEGGFGESLGYPLNAVPNSKTEGKAVGVALAKLGLIVYGIGHSLGAQLLGYAGRAANELDKPFLIIWGLDAARVSYEPALLYLPLDKTCAKTVFCVHCDMGGYGVKHSKCHVDFWLNYGNYNGLFASHLQPGAPKPNTTQEFFTSGSLYSHNLCWEVFNVSQTLPEIFIGGKADNYNDFLEADGVFSVTNYIGPKADPEKTGNFYLDTMADYPYGQAEEGLKHQN